MHNAAVVAVRYLLTESEFVAAQRALISHRMRRRMLWLVVAATLVAAGLYVLDHLFSALLFVVVFPLLVAAMWLLLLPLAGRRLYRRIPSEQREQRVEYSADGLMFESAMAHATVRWSAYSHYLETDRLFLLHQPTRVVVPLPKRAFPPDELARFRELLVAHVPRDRPAPRPRTSVA